MTAQVGFQCVVKQSGAAVAITTEATTSVSSSIYQITDATKRVLDPDTAISVIDNGSGVADADVTIDYLFGKVTKNSGSFTGPVTVTGAYLPMFAELLVRELSLDISRNLLDITTMSSTTAVHTRTAGLQDMSGSFRSYERVDTDIDTGGTTVTPYADFNAGTRRVLEISPPSGDKFRAFIRFSGFSHSAEVDDLVDGELTFELSAATGTDQTEGSGFGWGT